jgi:hypothetical protein
VLSQKWILPDCFVGSNVGQSLGSSALEGQVEVSSQVAAISLHFGFLEEKFDPVSITYNLVNAEVSGSEPDGPFRSCFKLTFEKSIVVLDIDLNSQVFNVDVFTHFIVLELVFKFEILIVNELYPNSKVIICFSL